MSGEDIYQNRLYVGNLEKSTTKRDIENFFHDYGPVFVILHNDKCYAFVDFSDSSRATNAMCKLNGKQLNGRAWQQLKDMMKECGEVVRAEAHNREKNVGFVCFQRYEELQKAIKKFQGYEINGRALELYDVSHRPPPANRGPHYQSPARKVKRRRHDEPSGGDFDLSPALPPFGGFGANKRPRIPFPSPSPRRGSSSSREGRFQQSSSPHRYEDQPQMTGAASSSAAGEHDYLRTLLQSAKNLEAKMDVIETLLRLLQTKVDAMGCDVKRCLLATVFPDRGVEAKKSAEMVSYLPIQTTSTAGGLPMPVEMNSKRTHQPVVEKPRLPKRGIDERGGVAKRKPAVGDRQRGHYPWEERQTAGARGSPSRDYYRHQPEPSRAMSNVHQPGSFIPPSQKVVQASVVASTAVQKSRWENEAKVSTSANRVGMTARGSGVYTSSDNNSPNDLVTGPSAKHATEEKESAVTKPQAVVKSRSGAFGAGRRGKPPVPVRRMKPSEEVSALHAATMGDTGPSPTAVKTMPSDNKENSIKNTEEADRKRVRLERFKDASGQMSVQPARTRSQP